MKNATGWLEELEDAVMFREPNSNDVEPIVRRIQVDTLMYAAEVCRKDDGLSILAAGKLERLAQEISGAAQPNDPSSATRPARASACNLDAMAGFAAAHG